jgi:hypothetical protein
MTALTREVNKILSFDFENFRKVAAGSSGRLAKEPTRGALIRSTIVPGRRRYHGSSPPPELATAARPTD